MIGKLFKKLMGAPEKKGSDSQSTNQAGSDASATSSHQQHTEASQGSKGGQKNPRSRNRVDRSGSGRSNSLERNSSSERNSSPERTSSPERGNSLERKNSPERNNSSGKNKGHEHKNGSERQQQGYKKKHKSDVVIAEPWDISAFDVLPEEGRTRFHDFDLEPALMHGIADLGFHYCSPIQAQSLPYALKGQDVVGKAQTGTGKTAAFLSAIIDDLLKNPIQEKRYAGEARALVIAPTRELVIQIAEDAKLLCKYTDLKIHTLVGGMDYVKQQRHLHDDLVDILVATPGRLLDFCGNKDVYLDQLEILVIDEADRMLDMGFIPQVRQIVRQAPRREDRQTLFFSATFTDEVRTLVEQWTYQPVTVDIQPESVATDSVTQHVYLSSTEEKYTLLYNLIQQENAESMIVFANRRDECRDLQEKLQRHGIKAGLLSGEIAQNKRVSTLDAFKDGTIKVLVATDVAGRGIHISGISHVVNFTLPEEPEDYVHRIGRTGRAGKLGTSISFACEDDAFRLEPLQVLLGKEIKCEQPPAHLLLTPPELPAAPRRPRGEESRSGRGNRTSGSRGPSSRGRSPRG